jgi:hypothetical protein
MIWTSQGTVRGAGRIGRHEIDDRIPTACDLKASTK